MGFIQDLFKKKDNRANYNFTEEDRETSLEMRQIKKEMRELEKQAKLLKLREDLEYRKEELRLLREERLENLKPEIEEEEGESFEDKLILSILGPLINKATASGVSASKNPSTETSEVSLTENQIRELLKQVPKKILKQSKKMKDSDLEALIKQQIPNISAETLIKAVSVIRSI